jgi:hypothetical protein
MFAIPGIVCLLVFIYLRPQEYIPALKSLPMLYLFLGLAIFGYAVDLKLRRTKPLAAPQLGWMILFFAWVVFGVGIKASSNLAGSAVEMAIPAALFLLIAHGIQSFRGLQTLCAVIIVLITYLAGFGVQQGLAPLGCFVINEASHDGSGVHDGRYCSNWRECEADGGEPGADYRCEHVGLFNTSSIGGRVRYLGKLNDPNELAMVIGVGIPFAFAFLERKRSTARALMALGVFAIGMTCAAYTQSRGGQLVFLTVLGAYFIKKQGWKGLIYGSIVAIPVLLFGGRSGEEADSSSEERLRCWYEGMSMFRYYPIIGVGQGQFVEHHTQTAHNSYVLASAELGFFGLHVWTINLYLSMKIPVTALRHLGPSSSDGGRGDVARSWGMALIAAWAGFLVGIFFLSFCYHQILWIYMGLINAYYAAMKAHDDSYEVTFGWRDWWLVLAIDIFLVNILYVYTRLKGAP